MTEPSKNFVLDKYIDLELYVEDIARDIQTLVDYCKRNNLIIHKEIDGLTIRSVDTQNADKIFVIGTFTGNTK